MTQRDINYVCQRCGQPDDDSLVCMGYFGWDRYAQEWRSCEKTAKMQWWCGICSDFVTVKEVEVQYDDPHDHRSQDA